MCHRYVYPINNLLRVLLGDSTLYRHRNLPSRKAKCETSGIVHGMQFLWQMYEIKINTMDLSQENQNSLI